ncbi:unnamed protein product, partial [marine sediment metagenome]
LEIKIIKTFSDFYDINGTVDTFRNGCLCL